MNRLKETLLVEESETLENAISMVASAMSDPSRVRMLCALMDGRAWTATELSVAADIAASTASAHLGRLMAGKLIVCLSQGRHRYYRLAGQDIAALIEMMMGVSWKRIEPPATRTPYALRRARTCYDHLAGEVAVGIYEFMQNANWIAADGNSITQKGHRQLPQLGVVLDTTTRRKSCCGCLDWSERRCHLGGDAGAALLSCLVQKGWVMRTAGYREVSITEEGRSAFKRLFHIDVSR
ncbi:winged helix-turn-helix domain-containing protein [Pantoea sp. MBD-2R]|uniref:ArsR/SmtB family transcription factor n=1 Tax=Pantoea sp. MBD-2R TaxID=3141540 RepID=UPI00318337AD